MSTPEEGLAADPQLRAAVAALLGKLFDQARREERAMPHVILCFDPETGRRHAVGPFPDHFHARIASIILGEQYRQAELDDVELTLIPLKPFGTRKEEQTARS